MRAWRPVVAIATLAVIVHRLGTGPFPGGLSAVDPRALAAGAALGPLTAVCCAWRWTILANRFGARLRLWAAVAAYYRSMFPNLTPPGRAVGVGDRAVSHGRKVGDLGRAVVLIGAWFAGGRWPRQTGFAPQAVAVRQPSGANGV